jgi:hypothetical protein
MSRDPVDEIPELVAQLHTTRKPEILTPERAVHHAVRGSGA